ILYEVEPLDGPIRVVVQSELVANEDGGPAQEDPRAAAAMQAPLQSEDFFERGARVILAHSTRRSGLLMAAGMDHVVEGPDGTETVSESGRDVGRVTVATELAAGERLRVIKFLAYGWSSERSLPAVRDQVVAALTQARHTGWQGLLDDQRAYLDELWDCADVELEGGAAFPWRTIRGHESSGYWPAGTAAFHIAAAIADAVARYQAAAEDEEFEREVGIELLVETARLWRSLGHHDAEGRFRIDGVTGPDEYSAIADNNVYTNLTAQKNLRAAADAVSRHPRHAAALGA